MSKKQTTAVTTTNAVQPATVATTATEESTMNTILCTNCSRVKKCRMKARGTATTCDKWEPTNPMTQEAATTTVDPSNGVEELLAKMATTKEEIMNEKEMMDKLAREAQAFKANGKEKNGKHEKKKHEKKGYTADKEVTYIGLQPKVELYDGVLIVPELVKIDGVWKVLDVNTVAHKVPVSIGSVYEGLIKQGKLTAMTIASEDAGIKQQCVLKMIDKLIEQEWPVILAGYVYRAMIKDGINVEGGVPEETFRKYLGGTTMTDENIERFAANKPKNLRTWQDATIITGNLKKSECILVSAPKSAFDEIFGCDVRALDLWKQSLPLLTPPILKFHSANFEKLRVLVLDPQVTPWGFPQDDGPMFATGMKAQYYKHEDLQDHPDAKDDESLRGVKIDVPKEGAKTYNIDRCMQFRLKEDKYHTSWKGNLCMDNALFAEKLEDYAIPEHLRGKFDVITTKDNIKVGSWNLKHMDIVEVDIKDILIPKFKMKKYWTSSMGAQCESSSNDEFVRQILIDHGALRRAQEIVRPAIEFKQDALWNVMLADKDSTMEDAPSIPAKFAASIYKNGEWFVPAFLMDTMDARTETFYTDYVLKVRIFDDGFYAMPSLRLDKMERAYKDEHGKLVAHIILPRKAELQNKLKIGDMITFKRDPFVGPSNMVTAIVAGFHGRDFVQVSNQVWYSMYGDFDGDTIGLEVDTTKRTGWVFETILREAPGASAPKQFPETLPSTIQWILQHRAIGYAVLKSAIDTGSLDLARRQIIVERRWAGNPMSNEEKQACGEDCQKAIEGMKHMDSGVGEDAREALVKKYGVGGKLAPARKSYAEACLERKDVGITEIKGKPSARLRARVKVLKSLAVHKDNPYYEIFMALADVNAPDNKTSIADSEYWQKLFKEEELAIIARFKDPTTGWSKANFGWDYDRVNNLSKQIDQTYRGITKAARKIADDDLRRAEFSRARKEATGIIMAECTQLFDSNDITNPDVKRYKMTLLVALGVRSFGKGHYTDETGDFPVTYYYGKAGYAFWTLEEEMIVSIFKHFSKKISSLNPTIPVNPKFDEIDKAIIANREKVARREELKRLRWGILDEETMDI